MANQLLDYNNPECIINWIDHPSQAHSHDLPIDFSQPQAPQTKRKPFSSRSLQEPKRLSTLPQDDPRVPYDSALDATRFPSSKVSSE